MVSEAMNDVPAKARVRSAAEYQIRRVPGTDISARGEPALWILGGTLALGILMILGFLLLVIWNGALALWPRPLEIVQLTNGKVIAGEPRRTESFRPSETALSTLTQAQNAAIQAAGGLAQRTLYHTGNYDLYNEDFIWVPHYERAGVSLPRDIMLFERLEWGPFIGRIQGLVVAGLERSVSAVSSSDLARLHDEARERWYR